MKPTFYNLGFYSLLVHELFYILGTTCVPAGKEDRHEYERRTHPSGMGKQDR